MQFLGFEITRTKSTVQPLTSAEWNRGPWLSVRESFAGAWQRGLTLDNHSVIKQSTVWACITLIMQDIGKIEPRLIGLDGNIWEPVENPAYSPVLRRPNHYQNRIKFFEGWVGSKLSAGNTYVLKRRDRRAVVDALYLLNPERVKPLVTDRGDVFYQLAADNLSGLTEAVSVPASEIIHDVGVALYHPLCGLSPLVACTLAASQSLSIQQSSARFFQNNSKPGGVLTAPNKISEDTAKRIKEHWEANFAGEENAGKVAVLGDGLKYEQMAVTAVESELAKQLAWADEKICAVFHVPPFMVGVGPMPTYDNIEKLNLQYYSQCLQSLIENIEICLDEGLGLGPTLGIQFDLDGLMRMDQATLMATLDKGKNILTANEQRQRLNKRPVPGGDAVYRQHQDYSLEALAKRDAQADPFATGNPAPTPAPVPDDDDEDVKGLHMKAAELRAREWYPLCPPL